MKLKQKKTERLSIFKKIFLFAGIIFFASGCGSAPTPNAGPVTLTFWDPFENSQDIQPLIESYRAAHPNVTVVYTKKDIDSYSTDLLNALASGNGPDIFSINNAWVPSYSNKIVEASSSVFNLSDYKKSFVDVAVSDFTKDGKILGVPLSVDSLALYYNKDILGSAGIATPPKTWNEFVQDVQKIKKQDRLGYFTVSGAALGTNGNVNRAVDILYLFMLQQGVVPFSPDGAYPMFDQSITQDGNSINPGQQALNFYTSFASPSSPNYNWNYKSDYSIDAFANGRAAFLFTYSFNRQKIVQKSPNLNFDVAPVPQPNLDKPSVNFSNYWGEVVSRQTKNPQVAWDFLKFISSKNSLDKFYAQNKMPSSRRDLIELQITDPEIGVFANANLTAKQFFRPDQEKVDSIFGKMIDNIILNGLSVDQALSQAAQQASAIGNSISQ